MKSCLRHNKKKSLPFPVLSALALALPFAAAAPAPAEEARPAEPSSQPAVFDKIRWNMSLDEVRKSYEGRTFWAPTSNEYLQCLKWPETIMEQVHFMTLCANKEGLPVSLAVNSEDVLTPEWIRIVGERYGVSIPFDSKDFREERTMEFASQPTLVAIQFAHFEHRGRQKQELSLRFVHKARNEAIQEAQRLARQASSPPTPVQPVSNPNR